MYATWGGVAEAAERNVAALRASIAQVEAMGAVMGEDMPDLVLQVMQNQLLMWQGFANAVREVGRES